MGRRKHHVNEVAQMTGVSVRTLHHYDAIGLLVPSARTGSGYRLYDEASLFRLQQILIGRELGLSLEQVRRSLDDPEFDRRRALLAQREQLEQRARQTARMIGAIDRALRALDETLDETEEETMSTDLKEIFDGFDPSRYEDEAKERWGHTNAYKESARRTKSYTKADWEKLKAEQDAIHRAAADALARGRAPDEPDVMDIAEQHRLAIDRWFYPCSHAMQRALADMYEADERFAENIDRYAAGLTPFLAAAIRANAARHGA